MTLTAKLRSIKEEVMGYARDYGLDFFDTYFELLDYDEINEVASYGGYPSRYPHWRFGMQFEQLGKGYQWGLSKIYEMVINNDPCWAYLQKSNSLVDQKIVMAHVLGHSDFFKNNFYFSKTNRKMMNGMANHATRIRKYIDRYGMEKVERFIDACLSLEDLLDPHFPFTPRKKPKPRESTAVRVLDDEVWRIKSKDYMDSFINPPEFIKRQREDATLKKKEEERNPPEPMRDVLLFLLENAPLHRWQRDILGIVREEAYYFLPQKQTKIMNEGWASYWHSRIMTEKCLLDSEIIDFADHHSRTLVTQPGQINPYKLGIELFRDIHERWDTGRFGVEYDSCDDAHQKTTWDRKLGLGTKKIYEVRKLYNDLSFIDEFLTKEFAERQKLFSYRFNRQTNRYEIESRDVAKVKAQLLFGLTNFGNPIIDVLDANHGNRGELLLGHRFEGVDMRIDLAAETLKNIQFIWKRPVNLVTVVEGDSKLLQHDGREFQSSDFEAL
jgi:stage V sporulation protein R